MPASLAWLTRPAAAVPAAAGLGSGGAAGAAAGAALATAVGAAAEAPNRLLLAARDAPANAAASALLPLAAAALACAPSTDAGASGVVARLPVSAVFLQKHHIRDVAAEVAQHATHNTVCALE